MQEDKRASLPARHELKYLINPGELEVLRRRLRPMLHLDPHCRGPESSYGIRSLYLDDIANTAYFDKQAGVLHRDKYRIRIYNNSDEIKKPRSGNKDKEGIQCNSRETPCRPGTS